MSWMQFLHNSVDVPDEEVVAALGSSFVLGKKKEWPFVANIGSIPPCDVWRWNFKGRDEGKVLFRGAYYSADTDFPQKVARKLMAKGYKVRLGKRT